MRKKAQISLLENLYADLVLLETTGKHEKDELLYIKNAQNSVETCLSKKKNIKKNKNEW